MAVLSGSGPGPRLWKVNPGLFAAITALPIAILLAVALLSPQDAKTDDGMPLRPFLMIMAGFFLFTDGAVMVGYMLYNRNRMELAQNGLPGTATVLSAEDTGTRINDLPVIRLKLLVNNGFSAPYEVFHKETIPLLELPKFAEGAQLQVRVHPRKPGRLVLLY